MKTLNTLIVTLAAMVIVTPANAQLGKLGKGIPGVGGSKQEGGADVGKVEEEVFSKATPAADALYECIKLYAEALNLKLKDNTEAVKNASKSAIVMAKMSAFKDGGMQLQMAAKDPDKINMSPEQQEKFKQAHAKLREGFAKFVVVAVPVGLAIKEVTDKDPKALLLHKDLGLLGVACTKDVKTIADVGIASAKIGKAKVKAFPEGADDFNPNSK